jgi:cytochrome c-type biogenesis protein CcmH
VTNSIIVLAIAALMTAAAAGWTLRAYRLAGGGASSAMPALLSCGAVGLVTLVAYLIVGRPELPDAPFSARLEALRHRDINTFTAEELLVVLDQAERMRPTDPRPHLIAGRLLLDQERAQEAAREFDAALRRDPRSAVAMMGLGRAMVATNNGRVTPDALGLFQQASAADATDPAPWIYQAMAAMQDGRADDLRRLCAEAMRRGAPAQMCQGLMNGVRTGRTQ